MFRRHYIRELSSYLDNELPEKKRRIIETHLAGCARCRDELRQLQLLSVKLKEWRAPVMEEGFESTVRNTIVAQELERGTSQMKKTWTIMVPSGVLAAVLVVLFVGKQYLPKGPQVPIDKNQSVAVTTPHVAPKVPPPVVSQVPTVHDPALKIKLSEPSMQGPVFAYQGVMDAQRYYSGGYSPPPQTLMQRMMQEDSLAGYYPSQSEFFQEDYNRIYENEFRLVRNDSLSTFSIDVDTASYANVRRFLNGNTLPPEDAVRIEELVNYFTYDYPQPQGTDPFSVTTEVAVCPWNSGHRIALIGLQGKTMQTQDLPASNLVFLIDVSGSMKDYNKLPLLKSAFRLLVQQLRPEDRVSIVVYAGASGVVIDSVSGDQEEIIMQAIENLQAGGSTAGAAGIVQAYEIAKKNLRQDGNNRVILATDGDFNVGLTSEGELLRLIEERRNDGIFLTVLGFGMGNYKDGKMEQLADKGNGTIAYIDSLLEAKKVFVNQLTGTLFTIAKDVKIQVEFNPAQVKAYRLVGYENRMLENKDFSDDTKDAGEIGAGHTVTALYEIVPADSKEEFAKTDELKYQQVTVTPSDELLTVKLRYKEPKEDTSKLLSTTIKVAQIANAPSENFRFATSVAEWGLLLRNSSFKANASYQSVLERARAAKGQDADGYRAEFIKLVELAQMLDTKSKEVRK